MLKLGIWKLTATQRTCPDNYYVNCPDDLIYFAIFCESRLSPSAKPLSKSKVTYLIKSTSSQMLWGRCDRSGMICSINWTFKKKKQQLLNNNLVYLVVHNSQALVPPGGQHVREYERRVNSLQSKENLSILILWYAEHSTPNSRPLALRTLPIMHFGL